MKINQMKAQFDLAHAMAFWQKNGSFNYNLYLSIIKIKHNGKN